jgi:hypothetical protein
MKRQITEDEKAKLISKYRQTDGFIHCFVDNERIENEKEIHFDHIEPFAKVEETSLNNIAPVCKNHNLAKKDMTLSEYRDKLQMENFFENLDSAGKQPKLNDVLTFKFENGFGFPIQYDFDSEQMKITVKYFQDKDKVHLPKVETYHVYQCPKTKMNYFYALVPARNILNDGREDAELELQPRPLYLDHLWILYRHLRVNTQIQPSICRVDGSVVLVFDGQHKAAAQIWMGADAIDAKVYIKPDVVWLMRTNLFAHEKGKQRGFYSSILADKMAQLYGVNWHQYIDTPGKKSEKGFCTFIKYAENKPDDKPEKQIEAFLMTSILSNRGNDFSRFMAPENKTGKQYAISWDSMKKHYFRYFLTKPPLQFEIDSKDDYRNQEIRNNVRLLNILAKQILIDKWNPSEANEAHKKAERIFRPGAIMAWFPMLKNVIYNKLDLVNPEEAEHIFFRNIPEDKWSLIEGFVKRMFDHQIWVEIDTNIDVAFGNKKLAYTKELFAQKGFTTQWILGINTI